MTVNRRSFLTASAAAATFATSASAALAQGEKSATDKSAAKEVIKAEGREIDAKQPGKSCKTKFAVNVEMWFGRMKFLDRLRAAAALGFPAVEMWPYQGKDIDETAKPLKELGIEI
jgi:hypothetical protein